jgi:Rieske Fe-S protein
MPGNDQEQFEDYQELEHFIEELREGHISPALRASMVAHQAGIYSMAVLLHSASPEGTEIRPEFIAALWVRLEQELQHPSAGSHGVLWSRKKQPEQGRDVWRRRLLTGGAIAAASFFVGMGGERLVEQAGNDRVPATTGASAIKGQAGSTSLPEDVSTVWYFVTTLAHLGNEAWRFTTDTMIGYVLREDGSADPDQATIIALSAACTHLGCLVQWHSSDRTFWCPCHAGVFTADGAVDRRSLIRSLSPLSGLETRVERGKIYVKVPTARQ